MLTRDKIVHHINHLQELHLKLDTEIDHLEQTGFYEDIKLMEMKKRRLHLRDEIEQNKHILSNLQ